MRTLGSVAAVGAGLLVWAMGGPSFTAAPTAGFAGATISGKVRLEGKAPANPAIDMSEEAKCAAKYPKPPHDEIVAVNATGALANVFIYVKAGLPADAKYPTPTTPVVIDQSGCLYHPRVFGIMVNQTLQIKNSDGLLHNIKAMGKKNRPFNISQPTNMTTDRTFSAEEVMLPFECNVHGWMHAWAGVLPHPFFATTGPDGAFAITGLPPGTYTIEAWHEKYGTQDATVTVAANAAKTAAFTFTAK
jgi:hypothetical protein